MLRDPLWLAATSIRRLGVSLRTRGARATAALALEELRDKVWLDRVVLRYSIDTSQMYHRVGPPPQLELREAHPDDHAELLSFSRHFDRRELQRRLAAGHRCFIGRVDGRIVFYGWVGVGTIHVPLLGWTIALPPDTAYFYNALTDERFRDHAALPIFASSVRDYCLANGIPRAFTLVDTRVGLPVRAYMKVLGATEVVAIEFRRRGPFKRYRERPVSRAEASKLVSRRTKRRRARPV